jgi:hypothetical protein
MVSRSGIKMSGSTGTVEDEEGGMLGQQMMIVAICTGENAAYRGKVAK